MDFNEENFDIDLGTMDEDDNEHYINEDFYSEQNESLDEEGIVTKRNTIIAIVVSIILVIIAITIYTQTKKSNNKDISTVDVRDETVVNNKEDMEVEASDNSSSDYSTWQSITSEEDITANKQVIKSTFTITNIKYLARTNADEIEVKAKLIGNLSGYTGTYEIDVPYTKGVKLDIGNKFEVDVYTAIYKNNIVVEKIEY